MPSDSVKRILAKYVSVLSSEEIRSLVLPSGRLGLQSYMSLPCYKQPLPGPAVALVTFLSKHLRKVS